MDNHLIYQKANMPVPPEKLYTQTEVDNLLANSQVSRTVHVKDTEEVAETVDRQKQLDTITVAELVRKSNRILVSISSHAFPVDLFPDVINVEEGRITLINRHFLSSNVHSVDIKDISNIFINRTFIFAQLVFISNTFEDNEIRMRNLRPDDAVYVRRIIEGMRVFENNKIDTSGYTTQDLLTKLEELSTTEIVT